MNMILHFVAICGVILTTANAQFGNFGGNGQFGSQGGGNFAQANANSYADSGGAPNYGNGQFGSQGGLGGFGQGNQGPQQSGWFKPSFLNGNQVQQPSGFGSPPANNFNFGTPANSQPPNFGGGSFAQANANSYANAGGAPNYGNVAPYQPAPGPAFNYQYVNSAPPGPYLGGPPAGPPLGPPVNNGPNFGGPPAGPPLGPPVNNGPNFGGPPPNNPYQGPPSSGPAPNQGPVAVATATAHSGGGPPPAAGPAPKPFKPVKIPGGGNCLNRPPPGGSPPALPTAPSLTTNAATTPSPGAGTTPSATSSTDELTGLKKLIALLKNKATTAAPDGAGATANAGDTATTPSGGPRRPKKLGLGRK